MEAAEALRGIERLEQLNAIAPVTMPELEITDADYQAAHEACQNSGSRLTPETFIQQYAELKCRERQLVEALKSLALERADHNDAEDIIKRWREHAGFSMDEDGQIHFAV